tara:strand:+ start:83 stop:403 length:321 start_codon:yes stop_codon:yes gene_type:complete
MKDNLPTYKLVEKQDVDYYGFQITEGEYKDVVYYYGEVKIEEDVEADNATLNFNYQIDNGNEKYSIEQLEDSINFNNLMGDILASVLDKEEDEEKYGEESTKDNTQ